MKVYRSTLKEETTTASPEEVIKLAYRTYGRKMVMMSSFTAESAMLIHMVTRIIPNIPIIFIDTGYNFPETYAFVNELTEKFKLNLHRYTPKVTPLEMEAYQGKLWRLGEQGKKLYNEIRRVEPMRRAFEELKANAVLTGVKRYQAGNELCTKCIELNSHRVYLVHPLLELSQTDVMNYFDTHQLPYHPLVAKGFKVIGDVHSTLPAIQQSVQSKHAFEPGKVLIAQT